MVLITAGALVLLLGLGVCLVGLGPWASKGKVPPPGLVSWWRGEGDASDAAGANTGVVEGGVAFVAGEVGQAFSFDGRNSYVEVPDAPSLRLTNELTIEFWVKRQRLNALDYLIEKGGDWIGTDLNYAVALHDSRGNWCLYFLYNGGLQGGGRIDDTNWHHCAVVATNGQPAPAIYIDGVQQPITFVQGSHPFGCRARPARCIWGRHSIR